MQTNVEPSIQLRICKETWLPNHMYLKGCQSLASLGFASTQPDPSRNVGADVQLPA